MNRPRVFLSPLTGRAYFTSNYREDSAHPGRFIATSKVDVTEDVVRDLMAQAWARGWNECNAATEGEAPPNPYREQPHPSPRAD